MTRLHTLIICGRVCRMQATAALTCNPPLATSTEAGSCAYAQVHLADLNGDGTIDVLLERSSGKQEVHLNDGFGQFLSTGSTDSLSMMAKSVAGLALGDVDGDADVDVIILTASNQLEVHAADFCTPGGAFGLGACYACPQFTVRSAFSNTCIECPAHHVQASATSCAACPAGHDRAAGQLECQPCALGSATVGAGAACSPCEPGSMAAISGASVCSPCPVCPHT